MDVKTLPERSKSFPELSESRYTSSCKRVPSRKVDAPIQKSSDESLKKFSEKIIKNLAAAKVNYLRWKLDQNHHSE